MPRKSGKKRARCFAVVVDEVSQIIRVLESSIRPAFDLIHQIHRDYISGIYTKSKERLIIVFNLEKMLSKGMRFVQREEHTCRVNQLNRRNKDA